MTARLAPATLVAALAFTAPAPAADPPPRARPNVLVIVADDKD